MTRDGRRGHGRCAARSAITAGLTLAVALTGVPAAGAAVRLASTTSADASGTCLSAPCRIDRALGVAQAGDEVVLGGGTYNLTAVLRSANAVTIRPATGATRPLLLPAAGLTAPTLTLAAGGTVRDIDIEATGDTALELAGGARGIGLTLAAGPSSGPAARLVSSPSRTALISSVAGAEAGEGIEMVDPPTGAGAASLVNVTAVSIGASSWGVVTDMYAQGPVLKNVIARGTSKDLHGRSDTMPIAVSSSNFRAQSSANYTDLGANQLNVPVTFVDQAAGDLRLAAGSPLIDAGVADPLAAATIDPRGAARVLGSAPDIGAFEYVAPVIAPPLPVTTTPGITAPGTTTPGTTTTTTTTPPSDSAGSPGTTAPGDPAKDSGSTKPAEDARPQPQPQPLPLAAVAPPVLGERVAVDARGGTPLVRLPGSSTFVALTAAASVPVGSTVDATAGRVALTSVRDAGGRRQTGEFWGGVFVVRQSRDKVAFTDLVLTGGSFRGCPSARTAGARTVARSAARRKRRGAVVRSLWGRDDKGRFRTRGRNSVATVRGTMWLVQDRCDGTLTTVKEGAVSVKPTGRGRAVLVKAGGSHLVRPSR